MLLGPERSLMQYAGLSEECIKMILTRNEGGGGEEKREGGKKGEGVRWEEEEKNTFGWYKVLQQRCF